METDRIAVDVRGARYDVLVRRGLLQQAGAFLRALTESPTAAIVTDSNVAALHLDPLVRSLRAHQFEVTIAQFDAGESNKTLDSLFRIFDQLLAAKPDRSTPILALGGGVVGDMAGFVAATILRGVPFVQIPTTVLAMVDASVGGKTGVNHARGKNLIGAFYQPTAVFIDPEVLQTLPPGELRNGLAECIKHDLIRDADGFARLERDVERALRLDMEFLTDLIAHNVAIKARVVEADPFERGERAHLNFGHTFGHAIESATDFAVPHGQAVALGMVAASHVSMKLGMLTKADHERVVGLIHRAELPTSGVTAPADRIVEAMRLDKKIAAGRARFVLLERIGRAVVRDDVPESLVREAVEQLR